MDELKTLQRLGLTEYESRAYLSLARLGPSTVKEIVMDSKLPRNKAYEALQRLEEKNKAVSLPLSPRKYKISDPQFFKQEVNELNSAVDSIIKLASNPIALEFKELFWVIKTKKAIEERLALHNDKTHREILSCNNLSKILPRNIKSMKNAVQRGVKVKMICMFDKALIPSYRSWLSTGAEIRVLNSKMFGPLLPRVSVFDGNTARLTIGAPEVRDEDDYLTLWTESKVFAQMLKNHFMNMWKHSQPIEKYMK